MILDKKTYQHWLPVERGTGCLGQGIGRENFSV